ncbi:hypothetical protein [Aurantibacillus circumpalustris]|uniref:hypothetical protein n=1 Tax=Aurantibacillus circumpalustris TaxID=3036359 RepID=UPI00295B3C4D|nr:hypothetical protein [Aurantibacillus circumpalustris]
MTKQFIKSNLSRFLLLGCFILITFFLVLNRHSRAGSFNYHSEIWSDKAGYYIYLPATFNYKFNPKLFPDSIETKTGNGFTLDYENKIIKTKYTYGVAFLQLPFYLLANSISFLFNIDTGGFSVIHHKSIDIASVFYLLFGLFFLKRFLDNYFLKSVVYKVLIVLFLGTNLFYYSIDETGMSHIYSFAMFSLFLFILKDTDFLKHAAIPQKLLFGLVATLIILIRPINLIFLTSYFFLDIKGSHCLLMRLKTLVQPKNAVPIFLVFFLFIAPQLLYWKYAYNSFLSYSYGDEKFSWSKPLILETLFSVNNGLIPFTPLYILIFLTLAYMIKRRLNSTRYIIFYFITLIYLLSCWWDRAFGCAFGARNFVEHSALFSIVVAFAFKWLETQNKIKKFSFYLFISLIIILNLKMTYTYDGCFPGNGDWDWEAYGRLIFSPPK